MASREAPVIQRARSVARKTTTLATSPQLRRGRSGGWPRTLVANLVCLAKIRWRIELTRTMVRVPSLSVVPFTERFRGGPR